MTFIEIDDITNKIKSNVLADTLQSQNVIKEDSPILVQIEEDALSLVKSYLTSKYDVNSIFSQTGSSRDRTIVNIVVDIMIYELLCRLASDVVPEIRETKYERCLTMLKHIRDGILVLDIAEKNLNYDATSQLIWTSDKSNHYDW